jgi:DNA primase
VKARVRSLASISGSLIEEVRNYFDIVEVISSYIDLKKAGKNYLGLCPFHSEKTPSFTVTPDKQLFYCFGCQSGGNVFTFIMQIENLSFPEAVRFLADKANIKIDYREMSPAEQKRAHLHDTLLKINDLAQKYFQTMLLKKPEGKEALAQLTKRGLTLETITDFQLGYSPRNWEGLATELQEKGFDLDLAVRAGLLRGKGSRKYFDYFRGRIMFPIFDQQGRILGFGGRILGQGEPKYLNSPESPLFNKSSILFCLYQALPHIRKEKEALVVEGYMDAITLHQHGFKTTVAPLGTSLTDKQIALLRGRVERITLIFDADESGEKAALRGLKLLKKEGCQVRVARLPAAMDPDDFIREYGGDRFKEEVLEGALPLIDYSIFSIKKKFDLKKKEDRLGYWKETRQILAEIPEALEREEYLKKIAQEINVSLEVLKGDLEKIIKGEYFLQGKGPAFKETVHNEISLKELAEKELLSCLLHYPCYGKDIWNEIKPENFTTGPYREIAFCLFDLYKREQEINIAAILSGFSNQEMHKLLMEMVAPLKQEEETRILKTIRDCVKKIKALGWAEERKRLIKTLQNGANRSEISNILQKIQDLKKLEEGLHCTGEGEDF